MIWRTVILTRLLDARRIPLALAVITGAVVISVAVAGAGVFWRLTGLDDGRGQVALAGPAVASGGVDIAPILALAPFGGAPASAEASASGMILKAVFMAIPAEASSALIATGDGTAVAVYPGRTLPGGALVQSIGVDHVMLQVGGQVERLGFPEPAGAAGNVDGATEPAAAAAVVGDGGAARPAPAPAAPSTPSPTSGVMSSVVEQYRQRLAGNAGGVAREMGVTPTAEGYRVGDDLSPALRSAGLQPGDVVARVNNQPVGTDANPRALLDQAITSGGARVEVIRNGRRLTLSFPLR